MSDCLQRALDGWPHKHVWLLEGAVPPNLLRPLQRDAQALADAPNYWMPRSQVQAGPDAWRTPAERVIGHLASRHLQRKLPDSWQGAEYWVQVYEPGRGLAFHFDKDEQLLLATGSMVHPSLSSVLYLTGSCGSSTTCCCSKDRDCSAAAPASTAPATRAAPASTAPATGAAPASTAPATGAAPAAPSFVPEPRDGSSCGCGAGAGCHAKPPGSRQAPTVILRQLFDQQQGRPWPDNPDAAVLVYPSAGCYCLFDGALGHGVLDGMADGGSVRTTLLINWWCSQPRSVGELPGSQAAGLGLAALALGDGDDRPGGSGNDVAGDDSGRCGAVAGGVGGGGDADGGATSASGCGSDLSNAARRSEGASAGCSSRGSSSRLVRIPHIELPGEPPDPLLVDEVITSCGLRLVGHAAINIVALSYPGATLCPIDLEQQQQQGGGDAAAEHVHLVTSAALLPLHMMDESDSQDCSSSCSSADDSPGGVP